MRRAGPRASGASRCWRLERWTSRVRDQVRPASIMDSAIRPAEERPDLERYSLSIPLKGPATIKASTALGAFRGLTTFENLFFYHPKQVGKASSSVMDILADAGQVALGVVTETMTGHGGAKDRKGTWYAPAAPYQIEDKPAFGWRAVLLDTSRNWFGKDAILKVCGILIAHTGYQRADKLDARYHGNGQSRS